MSSYPEDRCTTTTSTAGQGRVPASALLATGALWLSGCVSPYVGCVIPGSTYEPNGPPAAWVQRNVPISPSPVEYAQRMEMAPPTFGAPGATGGPVMELGTPSEASPGPIQAPAPMEWQPTQYVPPGPQAQSCPPQAPPAELSPIPSEAAQLQSKIDQLSTQIAALDRRTQDQARALDIAQQDAQSAQQTTQRLETEFNTWRTELNLVRQAIQDQSHADLQALDELNSVLEQLVPEPTVPDSDPFLHDQSHMATGQSQGVRR